MDVLDEVIAFRLGYHGAHDELCVTSDVTTLSKIISGGFPVGAYVSTEEPMEPPRHPRSRR
jgi:glutamate-1-semialdehyde 2,1-aminomutase